MQAIDEIGIEEAGNGVGARCRWAMPSQPETSWASPVGVATRPSSDCPTCASTNGPLRAAIVS